ncbi:MAG: glycosyltransferase family 4 protein, partial [Bacteroidales bacterium]|nr:glycosyltransferase family 4 protein [Bacteroidales bacterium]
NYHYSKNTNSIVARIKNILGNDKKKRIAFKKIEESCNAKKIGLIHNVSEYLQSSCCLISPFSKPHFARPVIEAFLYKKPAIGSNVDGMDELIKDGTNGIIFKKNNPRSLANAINYILRNPQKAKEFGESGYTDAVKRFTNANSMKVQNIYNSL